LLNIRKTDMYEMKEIFWGSSEYQQMVQLRDDILRKPLNLRFSQSEYDSDKEDYLLTWWLNDELVGCLILHQLSDAIVKMRQVAVREDLQGKGIGRIMV